MKHRMFALTLAVLLLLTLCSGCAEGRTLDTPNNHENQTLEQSVSQAVTPAPHPTSYATPTPDQITQAEALEIALTHAGVTADLAQFLYSEFEIDDRVPRYEVQFFIDGIAYEYEVHAETGEILSFEQDL